MKETAKPLSDERKLEVLQFVYKNYATMTSTKMAKELGVKGHHIVKAIGSIRKKHPDWAKTKSTKTWDSLVDELQTT